MTTERVTTEVKYSCKPCGLHRVVLPVEARQDEPIVEWMNALTVAVYEDHHRRSPDCKAETISEVLIPMTGRAKLGGPVLQ